LHPPVSAEVRLLAKALSTRLAHIR
ncbi:hypothetical protein DBR06_SOUSAS10510058, partial [Sousa chinensis]